MKKITLTKLQAIRLVMTLDSFTGQRKQLRMVQELRDRIEITDEELQKLLTSSANGFNIDPVVLTHPDLELPLVPEEARKVLEILDAQTIVARDLKWANPLAKQLEEIIG